MEEFFAFFAVVIIISASGVMAPGPLFASTITSGAKHKLAGLKIAIGHTTIELPLVLGIGLGVLSLEEFPQFKDVIAVLGAASIFGFAILQIRSTMCSTTAKNTGYGPYITGMILTGLNPFFLVWWFSIGIKMISDAMLLWSVWGILIMFAIHIWMDFAWLGFVSVLSSKGTRLLSAKSYKIFMIGINGVMIYFGVSFLFDVI